MRILFITRKFPPSVGGMENAAYELFKALKESGDEIDLVAWGGSNKWLPVVYFWLFFKALFLALAHKPDVIYLQDGLMAPLGWKLKLLTRRPTVITIHGLEVTYKNPIYRALVLPFIKRQTAIVAVSQGTKQAVIAALGEVEVRVVNNGVRDEFYADKPRAEQLRMIAKETGLPLQKLEQSQLLVTTGRLVRRKGVSWFVDSVMPQLVKANPNVLYLVCGSGSQREVIEQAVKQQALDDNVKLLGRVSNDCVKALYNAADIFIMPNVPVPNDMEGFGLVAIEAASCGALVVASDLEGISDAAIDGQSGYLVAPKDSQAYVAVIERELAKRSLSASDIRQYVLDKYSWDEAAKHYHQLIRSLL